MADDFIPLNQSTPMQGRWQGKNKNNQNGYENNWKKQNQRNHGHHNRRWGNNSQHSSSFGSDCNSSYGGDNKSNIDAYLHPSMLKDPWEHLRSQRQNQ